jgi:hypothetical protein
MDGTGETQVSLTDPDCRAMATTSKQPRVIGYNVQSAVETKHHLIVAHEVTNLGYDRDALSMMALKARDAMGAENIEAIADKGYYKGEEIVACEEAGIAVTVSKPHTSNAAAVGRFDRADFTYHAKEDAFLCPAGKWLTYHYTNEEAGKTLRNYWTNDCVACAIKHRFTTGKERRIRRWEHEDILERVQRPQAAETLPRVPIAPIADNTAPSHTASRGSGRRGCGWDVYCERSKHVRYPLVSCANSRLTAGPSARLHRPVPNTPPTLSLTAMEVGVLDCLVTTRCGRDGKALSHYLIKVAKLGGYLPRAHDPYPVTPSCGAGYRA